MWPEYYLAWWHVPYGLKAWQGISFDVSWLWDHHQIKTCQKFAVNYYIIVCDNKTNRFRCAYFISHCQSGKSTKFCSIFQPYICDWSCDQWNSFMWLFIPVIYMYSLFVCRERADSPPYVFAGLANGQVAVFDQCVIQVSQPCGRHLLELHVCSAQENECVHIRECHYCISVWLCISSTLIELHCNSKSLLITRWYCWP